MEILEMMGRKTSSSNMDDSGMSGNLRRELEELRARTAKLLEVE
jgi:hypothetical protein